LRSDKTHVYDGGLKVPTCVRWPGHIKAGQVTDFRALAMDIIPTLADICGVPIKHEIDGRSFKKLLLEGKQEQFEHPVFHMWLQHGTKECLRHGDWKLVRDKPGGPFELFNMKLDPYEGEDLAKKEPERLKAMIKVLEAHMAAAKKVPWKRPK
jgi:arylsulfatase A-like enzyme